MIDKPIAVGVVFFGDSITYGQYVDAQCRWSDLLASDFQEQFLNSPVNLSFSNKGVSGQTTREALERFPTDVQGAHPDILTIQFGLNDCNCWVTDRGHPRVSEAAYRANLVEMIDRASLFGVKHLILSTNHPTLRHKILLSGESLETRRSRYNDIVREVAREKLVTLCDIDWEFNIHSRNEYGELLLPYPDILHLSKSGHELYARIMKPVISKAIDDVVEAATIGKGTM